MNIFNHENVRHYGVFITSAITTAFITIISLVATLLILFFTGAESFWRGVIISTACPILIGYPTFHKIFSLIDQLDKKEKEMRKLATKDHLTDIWNRRFFIESAEKEVKQAIRHDRSLSLMIIDLDLFKNINDTYGHLAGDKTLRIFCEIAQEIIRTTDIFGRIGGEEFAALLPDCPGDEACQAAERLREAVWKQLIESDAGTFSISISVGVATLDKNRPDYDTMANAADKALYAAKEGGRNTIRVMKKSCAGCEKVDMDCDLRFAIA